MTEVDYYENVRQKLTLGQINPPPKHKLIFKLLKLFWNEEEIKILTHFPSAEKSITLEELEAKTGIPQEQIKKILARPVKVGTISEFRGKYCVVTILPGVFEKYFIHSTDTEENLKKAAIIFRSIIKKILPSQNYTMDFKFFRPLLPYDAEEKLIEINETIDAENKVLPYELVKELIDKNEHFGVIRCQCRHVAEISGEPCKTASADMGCFVVGPAAQLNVSQGLARSLTKEEAIEFIKATEKAGLVHNTVADISFESSLFICNCCSCCCGVLSPAKQLAYVNIEKSNYTPQWDMDLCNKDEICIKKCPNGAIYHRWAEKTDGSDELMVLREERCIGCGVCAANCKKNAIKMVKTRNEVPPDQYKIGNKSFLRLIS